MSEMFVSTQSTKELTAKKLSFGIVLACSVMAFTGCSRSDNQEKTQETTKQTTTKVEQKPKLDCTNPQVSSAIIDTLSAQIQQASNTTLTTVAQQANVTLDATKLQNNLGQTSVSLEQLRNNDNACHATLMVALPQTGIDGANRIFERLREPNLAAKATSLGYRMQNNILIADNQLLSVTPVNGLYQVNLDKNQDMIKLVSDVMANATLAQSVTPKHRSNNTATASTPKRQVTQRNNGAQSAERDTTRAQRANQDSQPTRTATRNDTTTQPLKKPADVTAASKTVKPSETKSVQAKTPETKAPSETTSKPVATGNQQLPNDGELKLSIEEKNEKY